MSPVTQASHTSAHNRVAMAALLIGGAAIGGSPIFVRLSEVGPMATAFWRVALALIPLIAWSWFRGEGANDRRPEKLSEYALLVLPGVFLAIDLAAWHYALTKTSVAEQGQFSVNGQRADANYFMVDGVSAKITPAGFGIATVLVAASITGLVKLRSL